jgi:putative addiction module component (TIGR02574 family)
MSVAEKIELIEAVWASLRESPGEYPSPSWHKDVLEDRKRRIEAGEAKLSAWTEARQRLESLG